MKLPTSFPISTNADLNAMKKLWRQKVSEWEQEAAPAGRVVKQEIQRIERSEVKQWGQVSAAELVGGGKQTRQACGRAKTNLDAS